jgi:hypothetical protein
MARLYFLMRPEPVFSLVVAVLMSILLELGASESSGQTNPPPEYQLKSVILYNFAQFVDWPSQAFSDAQAPLVIGILGDDSFGSYLDETVRGEKANGHPLVVQRFRRLIDVKATHLLFISESEKDRLEQIFTALRGRPVFTVGDTDGFCARGGMARLLNDEGKIRVRINLEPVKNAGLTVSSKLLRVADVQR